MSKDSPSSGKETPLHPENQGKPRHVHVPLGYQKGWDEVEGKMVCRPSCESPQNPQSDL